MAEILKNAAYMALPMNIKRGNPIPLDTTAVWYSLDELQAYATSGATGYVGQILSLVDESAKTVKAYIIDGNSQLQEVGSATLGDDHTIDLDIDTKKLSLHDFGKYYYAFSTDEDGNSVYTKTAITEANKAKLNGLEARIALESGEYVLAWYEPNTTTVEGVSKELASVKQMAQDNANLLNGDTSVANSVNKRIADAIANVQQFKYEKVSVLPETGVAGTIYLKEHVIGEGEDAKTHYDEYLYIDGSWEEIGALDDIDLSNYYTKAETASEISSGVKVEENRATAAEGALSTRIKSLEDVGAEKNKIEAIGIKTTTEGEYSNVTITTSGRQAQIDLSGYATKTALDNQKQAIDDDIAGKVTALETKISTAQSNAEKTAKDYTDQEVGKSDAAIASLKDNIGTIPEGSNVMAEVGKKVSTTDFNAFKETNTEAIATAKSEAITAAGTAADTKISTAIGAIGEKSVKEYVDDAVTAAAPADYATVKADVAANKEAIAAINNTESGILAQAKADATSKVDSLKGGANDAEDAVTVANAIKQAKAAKTAADAKVASITGDKTISAVKGDGTTDYTLSVKISNAEGNLLTSDENGLKVLHEDAPEYSIVKSATATGYAATYNLTKAGAVVGESINIPKDYIVKSAALKECTTVNVPQEGFAVGDKYIEFIINTKDGTVGTEGESKIYLNVKDLVDVYTAGNGIEVSAANVISAKVVAANGLSVDASGIKLGTAGKDAEGEGYHAGAMTAADAEKLAGVATGAQVNVLDGVLDGEGEALTITNKKVQLPLATATKLGLVKGSEGANKVQVAADGTMSVGSLNASTLVSDQWLLIDGGDSADHPVGSAVAAEAGN